MFAGTVGPVYLGRGEGKGCGEEEEGVIHTKQGWKTKEITSDFI